MEDTFIIFVFKDDPLFVMYLENNYIKIIK